MARHKSGTDDSSRVSACLKRRLLQVEQNGRLPQLFFAAVSADPSSIAIHDLSLFGFPNPVPAASLPLRDLDDCTIKADSLWARPKRKKAIYSATLDCGGRDLTSDLWVMT